MGKDVLIQSEKGTLKQASKEMRQSNNRTTKFVRRHGSHVWVVNIVIVTKKMYIYKELSVYHIGVCVLYATSTLYRKNL